VAIVICMLGLSQARNLAEAVISMIILTMGTSTVFGLANTIVQERAPHALRGRVSALAGMSFFGVLPFSGLIMTKFADLIGLRVAMGAGALIFGALATLLIYRHHCACARQPAAQEPEVSTAA
jgi:MFS family permease